MTQRMRGLLIGKTNKPDEYNQPNENELTSEQDVRTSRENAYVGHPHNLNAALWSQLGSTVMVRQDPRLHRSTNESDTPDHMTLAERDCILRNLMQYLTNNGSNNSATTVSSANSRQCTMSQDPQNNSPAPVSTSVAPCQPEANNQSKRFGNDILQRLHAVVNEAYEHAKNDENLTAILNSLLAYKPSERDATQVPTDQYPHPDQPGSITRPRSEFDCRPFLGPKTPPSPNSRLRDESTGRSVQRPQDPRKPAESTTQGRRGGTCTCCQDQHSSRSNQVTQQVDVYDTVAKSKKVDPRCCRSPGRSRSITERRELRESSRDSGRMVCQEKRIQWTGNGCHSDLSPNRTERVKRAEMMLPASDRNDRTKEVCVCAVCLTNNHVYSPNDNRSYTEVRNLHSKKSGSHDHWSISPVYESPSTHHHHYHRSTSGRTLKETVCLPESHIARTFLEMPHRNEHAVANVKQHSRAAFDRTSRPRSPCVIDNESYRNRRMRDSVRSSRNHCETHYTRNPSNGGESREFHIDDVFRSKRFSPFTDCERKPSRSCKLPLGICHHTESSDLAVRFHASCSTSHDRRRSPDIRTSRQGVAKRSQVRTSRTGRSNHYCGPPSPYTVMRSYRAISVTSDSPNSPTPPTHEQQMLSRYSNLGRLQIKQAHAARSQSPLSPLHTQTGRNPRECVSVSNSSQVWIDLDHTNKLPSVVTTCAVQQPMMVTDDDNVDYQARTGTNNHEIIDSTKQQESDKSIIRGTETQNSETVDYGGPTISGTANQPGDGYPTVQSERRSVSASSSRSSCSSSSQTSSSGTSESGDSSSSSGSSSAGSGTESDHSGPTPIVSQPVSTFAMGPMGESVELNSTQPNSSDLSAHINVLESTATERDELIATSPTEPSIQIAVETTWDDGQGAEIETDYAQSEVIHLNLEVETNDANLLVDSSERIPTTVSETEHAAVHRTPAAEEPRIVENHQDFITTGEHILSPSSMAENVKVTEPNRDVKHKRSDHRRKSARVSDETGHERTISRVYKTTDPSLKALTETHCSAEEEGEVFSDGTSDVDENQSLIKSCIKHTYDQNENERVTVSATEMRCRTTKRPRSSNPDEVVHLRETNDDVKRHKTCRTMRSQTNDMDKFKAPTVPKSIRYERFKGDRDLGKDHSRSRFHSIPIEDKLSTMRDIISSRSNSYERNDEPTMNGHTRTYWNRSRYHPDPRPLHLRGRYSKPVFLQTTRPRGHRCSGHFESTGPQRYPVKSRVFYRTQGSYLSRNGNRFVLTSSSFDRATTQRRDFDLRDYKLNRMR
ncbi:hypothetical protein FGIG_06066 [Fasciola gigantica]|uniref:Uncharacterized protein n=1 Tax=Fasciola gigantica TaxID=46835 RepID=A0A504YGX6_FASGI|nr:hypothetical protein FGIG_06066 [Fasciola gigantica]